MLYSQGYLLESCKLRETSFFFCRPGHLTRKKRGEKREGGVHTQRGNGEAGGHYKGEIGYVEEIMRICSHFGI